MEVIDDLMIETKKPSQEPSSQTVGQALEKAFVVYEQCL